MADFFKIKDFFKSLQTIISRNDNISEESVNYLGSPPP